MSHLRIIVAGGGISGLATATAVARTGHSVTVVERAERLVDVGSGLVLSPNGVKAANAIDPELGRRIRDEGSVATPDRLRPLLTAEGRQLSAEPVGQLGDRYGAPQISLLRSTLQQALVDSATKSGVELVTGATITSHGGTAYGVQAELSTGGSLRGDLLVGADGVRSTVRAGLRGDTPPRYSGYTSVRGRCPAVPNYPHGFVASGRGVQLFVAPVSAGQFYWAAKITAAADDWPRRPRTRALADLLDLLAGWAPAVRSVVRDADADDVTITDIHDRDPDRYWIGDRIVLVGDAAHPMVPAMGQGANMALEDAAVLASELAEPFGDCLRALDRFVSRREPRTTAVVLASRRQGERDQGAAPGRALLRNMAMRLRGRKDAAVEGLLDWTPPSLTGGAPIDDSRLAGPRSTGLAIIPVGPVWRPANVRSGPWLDSPVVATLDPQLDGNLIAEGYVQGDCVIEGDLVSTVWLKLADSGWCSAVNFRREQVAALPFAAVSTRGAAQR